MNLATFRALRHRDFRLLFFGQLVSMVGTWMQSIAQGWLVYRLTGQPAMLGIATFASLAPAFLLSPLGGVLADRLDPRRLAMLTQGGLLLQALLLAVPTLAGQVGIKFILLLALFMGVVNAFDLPAGRVLVTRTVPQEDLPNAIALVSTLFHGSRILGPSLAGLVVAAAGEGWCFLLNAFSYLAALGGLWAMRTPPFEKPPKGPSILSNLRESVLHVHRHRRLRRLFTLMGLVCLLAFPYITLLPAFARDVLRTDARGLGWLMGSGGAGATLGALILASRSDSRQVPRIMVGSTLILGVFLMLFAASRDLRVACLLILPVAVAMVLHNTANMTLVQLNLPDHLRGRVMALHGMVFLGAVPLGSLLAGLAAQRLGIPWTMVLGGAGCSLAALAHALLARRERTQAQ
ncbi:MAG: MFS transporter [Acidobacteria bacterium]|nr:MFS transporter [Acidobacteriota bacterium]